MLPKLAKTALLLSSAGKYLGIDKVDDDMNQGVLDLYNKINKGDAIDCMLALHAASITSMSANCYSQAALCSPNDVRIRDLNLRYGLKGSATVVEIVKALDNRRGAKSEKVTVGQVNVEAGGQAIVGNVEAPAHPGVSPTKPSETE